MATESPWVWCLTAFVSNLQQAPSTTCTCEIGEWAHWTSWPTKSPARQEGLGSQPTALCRARGALMSIRAASWQLPKPVVVTEERDSAFPDPTWLKHSQVRRQHVSYSLSMLGQATPSYSRMKLMWFLPSRNFHSCCCSVAQLYPILCNPMDWSTRLPCPSLSPRVCSNSCPLSQWCHPTISFSVITFSSCPQSFLATGSFPMSQLFASGGQSIGALASASILPKNIQDWFLLGLTGLISLQSKGLSRVSSNTTVWKHQFFSAQPSLWSNSHICPWLMEKP